MKPIHSIQVPEGPRLAVTDIATASRTCGRYDVVISLVNPGVVLDWRHPRHHVFWLEDTNIDEESCPNGAFLEDLLEVDLTGASSVLIHCHAGYSRSPAAAMVLAKKLGTSLQVIEQGIDWNQADPNRLILALGEAHLGLSRPLRDMAFRRTGNP